MHFMLLFSPATSKIELTFRRGREVAALVLGEGGGVVTAEEGIRNTTSSGTSTGN